MNKKKILYKSIILFFGFIIIFNIYLNNKVYTLRKIEDYNKLKMLGEPIDLNTGLINNEYWNISSNGTNAIETRDGINNAIEYASNNKIENIKLEKGTYLVNTSNIEGYQRSINLKSNINLNLNGSTIKIEANSMPNYRILAVIDVENVYIFNGIIIGDRYEHIYSNNTTHEWGMGVSIIGSQNILISNVEIYNTTGDGIYIVDKNIRNSKNINISNCNIYNTRRQGISIISGNNVHIYNNEIHDINGTAPQNGIDLEKNNQVTQEIKNIYIYKNKFYNLAGGKGIHIYSFVENVYIDENEIYGNININNNTNKNNETIYIGNNIFKVQKDYTFNGTDTNITNNFKDNNLKNAILELIGKTSTDSIYESDIAKIASYGVPGGKQLNLANKGITKLNGIEIFAKYNLEWLYIDNNNIEDLTPISSIKTLTKLNASNNIISNISALGNLTNLKTINLTNNNIKEIDALKNAKNLEYIYLNNNKINSLDSLSNINTIKEIYCSENEIESIDNIINLNNLEILNVRKNKIKNILVKVTSKTLDNLNLSENRLLNIFGLENNSIENLNLKEQSIELGLANVVENQYIRINLPQIFSTIDNLYNIEVKNLSYYKFNDNYNSITLYSNELINKGLNIIVTNNDYKYFNYLIKIDNSIEQEVSKKFNIIKNKNENIVTGININSKVDNFANNMNFEDIYTITFYKNNKLMNEDEIITTGNTMRVHNSDKEFYQDYTVVLYGDTNGDGRITALDALNIIIRKINSDSTQLDINDAYVEAGRVSDKTRKDKLIPSSVDALAIVKSKLGTYEIKQK